MLFAVRDEYRAACTIAADESQPQSRTAHDRLRATAIRAQSQARESGQIEDDTYHRLEEEMDWAELNAIPADDVRLQSV